MLVGLVAAVSLATLGCDSDESERQAETESTEETSGDQPEEVVFAFQPQENPEGLRPDADRLADYMSDAIGVPADVYLPTSYAAVVEALRSENADVAYFSGWPYLIASRKTDVDLLVVEERNGNPYYHSRLYVDASSDIQSPSDLKGKSISFTSPTSTSGYLFPMAKVIEETSMETGDDPKSFFSNVVYAGGYQQSLQALLHDRVDVAAASDYAFQLYLSDEERKKIRILTEQGPVPTHGVAVRSALPGDLKQKIEKAFLALNDSEHNDLLKSLYGAEKLVERNHEEHVSALEGALETVGEDRGLEGFGAGSGSGHGSAEGSGEGSGEESGSGEHSGAESRGSKGEKGSEAGSGEGSHAGSGRPH